jgi:hypothetical protein
MRAIWKQAWKATVVPAALLSSAALGETRGAWVDPPADLLEIPAQAVEPSPTVEAFPPKARTPSSPAVAAFSSEPEQSSSLSVVQPRTKSREVRLSPEHSGQQGQAAPFQTVPRQHNSQLVSGPAVAPTNTSSVATRPSPIRGRLSSQQQAAQDLAVNYLDLWSVSNHQAWQTIPEFYSARVLFHGKRMGFGKLLAEKRRFARRWPDRDYRYRPDTMNVRCSPNSNTCTVRSAFDFQAANSKLGRRARGVGAHELVVSFAGGRPVIVSETSRVLSRKSRQ